MNKTAVHAIIMVLTTILAKGEGKSVRRLRSGR